MKFVSFNVNSIRSRMHQLVEVCKRHQPDVIGLQETKVCDEDFPKDDILALGYDVAFHGQKTHYGVALLSKHPLQDVKKGFASDDESAQKRLICATIEPKAGKKIHIINGYFPQGENASHETKYPNKRAFYSNLLSQLNAEHSPDENIIVLGDLNVAPTDRDIGIGEDNRKRWLKTGKCSFLPEEREWINTLMAWGLTDTYRHLKPEVDNDFSWFDYRSRGFHRTPKRGLRIDFVLCSQSMLEHCTDSAIDYDIRAMDKPSDHCPVWADFSL